MYAKSAITSIFLVVAVLLIGTATLKAQTYTSKQNGNWNTAATWNLANPYACGTLQPTPNINSYYPQCWVDVVIHHQVTFDSDHSFGGGYFRTLTVDGPNANLNFEQDLVFATNGQGVIFSVSNGGQINVPNGNVNVDRNGIINITGNSIVTVRDLNLVASNATINVEAGSQLIVLNNAILNPSTILNLQGSLTAKNLTFTSGGTLNASVNSQINVSNNTTLNSNTTFNLLGSFETENLIFDSGGNLNAVGNSQVIVRNNFELKNGVYAASGDSEISVGRNIQISGSGAYNASGNSEISVGRDIHIVEGGTYNASGDSEISVGRNMYMSGGGAYNGVDNTFMQVAGILDIASNNRLHLHNNSIFIVDGNRTGDHMQLSVNDNACYQALNYPNTCAQILPVDYLYTHAAYSTEKNMGILSWATSKEWENSHFEIQKSMGGVDNFISVAEIAGMGWKDSETAYTFEDLNLPLIATNIYYRLKQVDFNGKYQYSKVLSIRTPGVQVTQGVWRAYPNPTNGDKLKVSLTDNSQFNDEKISFRLVHPSFSTALIAVRSELELNDNLATLIAKVPQGIVVVEIQWGQNVEHIKVLKH